MKRTIVTVAGALCALLVGTAQVNAKGHACDEACEKLLKEPTPYRMFENDSAAWRGWKEAHADPVFKLRTPTTALLERPVVLLLTKEWDCVSAHFEREIFTSRSVKRVLKTKQLNLIRVGYTLLLGRPKLAKQYRFKGKPTLLVLGVRQDVVAAFSKRTSGKSVARALRKALKGQRAIERSTKSMTQNLAAAKAALAKREFREAGKKLSRVLRGKGASALKLEAEKVLLQLEAAGIQELKTLSKQKKEVIPQYLSLLELKESFQTVRKVHELVEERLEALESGPSSWRTIQEYKGKLQLKEAVALAKAGKRKQAREILKEVERDYLGLDCALKARRLLARLSK